ncbi:AsmA family protein [Piscinibacter sakaiensis]|uniref:AsmA family protein n=1 Tax=Piscinibacter sakaiensis TaxID=1547922 RepID=UPI003AAC0775
MTSTWLRRIVLLIGALLVLGIAAAAFLIWSFDANRYKAEAIEWMKTNRQRDLAITGPVELSVFPRLAVSVSGVSLSERGGEKPFATIDEASLAVQAMPLLRKQLVVDKVSARGVQVFYRRDADGSRNFDDLLGKSDPAQAAPADGAGSGMPMALDVSAVRFDDLRLQIDDRQAGLVADIGLQSFESGRLADQVETPLSFKSTLKMSQPQAMNLTLSGSTKLTPDFDAGGVLLRELQLDVAGDAAGVKNLAVALNGALAWSDDSLRAGPLKVSLSSASLGTTKLSPSTLQVQRLLFDPQRQKLELEAFDAALAGQLGQQVFELALNWPQLAVDASALQGSALSGRYSLRGATTLAGDFRSAAPSGGFDALRLPGLAIRVDGKSGPRQVAGSLQADATLRIGNKSIALESVVLQADLTEPTLQPLKLGLRGHLNVDAAAASWKFDGSMNANRFDIDGRAALSGERPRINAKARFDSLDLNKLLAKDAAAGAEPTPKAEAPADTPVDLAGLRALDGDFSLSAGNFVYQQYQVADARIDATLDDGLLRISRLSGKTWGGSIDASGSASAASQAIGVKLAADGVDVNALLDDVAGKDLLEGKGRVLADLKTQGATVGAMRSNLAGTASVRLRDGAVKGINLAKSFRQAKAALTMQQDAVSKASREEKTDFSELNASAKISDGVARSDDLELKSPFLRLGGDGSFDIGRGRIDYTARTKVIGSPTGQDGAGLQALRGVTVPVLLSGPFEAIDWKIQWSQVAASVLKNKLEDKIGGKLQDKLGDKLGGDLGARLGGVLGGKAGGQPSGSAATPAGAASAPPQPAPTAKPEDLVKDKLKGLFK